MTNATQKESISNQKVQEKELKNRTKASFFLNFLCQLLNKYEYIIWIANENKNFKVSLDLITVRYKITESKILISIDYLINYRIFIIKY